MRRFNPRRLSGRLATSLTFLFLFAIVSAVVAQFFIELFTEWGWYKTPSARLGAAMTAFSNFVTQPWFLVAAAFLSGLTAGMWVDYILRRWEASRAVASDNEPAPPFSTAAPGMLDFIVEGSQAAGDLNKTLEAVMNDLVGIKGIMVRYKVLIDKEKNPTAQRKVIAKMSGEITTYAANFDGHNQAMDHASQAIQSNTAGLIQNYDLTRPGRAQELANFVVLLVGTRDTIMGVAESMPIVRNMISSLSGASRELNFASGRLLSVIEQLQVRITGFADVCEQLRVTSERKLAEGTKPA